MTDRDHFAAAALTGLLDKTDAGKDLAAWWPEMACQAAYRWADAMLRCRAGGDCPLPDNAPNHDAAPAARADSPDERPPHAVSASGGTPSAASRDGSGTGDTQEIAAYARFVGQVMNWISEATSAYASACSSDGGRKIMAQACSQCWDAFDRIAPTDHGASPEARASVESVAPQPTTRGDSDRTDKAAPRPSQGTGDTPATHATRGEGSEQREGTEPVAFGVEQPNGEFAVLAFSRQRAEDYATASDRIVPLYRKTTLTDAERGAVALFAATAWSGLRWSEVEKHAATLRGLLERLGGGR